MFNKKTLFVVGAGASYEVGLPIGSGLKKVISNSLDIQFENGYSQSSGDEQIWDALQYDCRKKFINLNMREYQNAAWQIRDALPQAISIDNYMDAHQNSKLIELCGKVAITHSILMAEQQSKLYIDPLEPNGRLNFQGIEDSWLNKFMQLLTENCREENLEERLSSITMIVFNYDRCIEHFLYQSLQNYYQISAADASNLVKRIKIYHPYGTVGNLEWYGEVNSIGFGAGTHPQQLLELASQIKTFTEGTDPDSSDVTAIHNELAQAEITVFLGFAYHRQNLQLLQLPSHSHNNPRDAKYYGTALNISASDCQVITQELRNIGSVNPENITLRNDLTCNQLFTEYWRSFSLS